MKKILLLLTGGTIASEQGEQGLSPKTSSAQMTAMLQIDSQCSIDCRQIMNLDSSNMQPEELKQLAQAIFETVPFYDGFVVAHGTDTMAYTASMLSYMLLGISKPVILTGSQIPITFSGTDAIKNLEDAILTAANGIGGVYIVFDGKIIQGVRASKLYSESFHAFQSINAPLGGQIENKNVIWHKKNAPIQTNFLLRDYLEPKIFVTKLFPGTDPHIISLAANAGYRGMIIESFGAGGVPSHRRNLLPEIKKAIDSGVTVVCSTQCLYEGVHMDRYTVGVQAAKLGMLSAKDMTFEALITKLMWILGQTSNEAQIQKMLYHNYCGEISNL